MCASSPTTEASKPNSNFGSASHRANSFDAAIIVGNHHQRTDTPETLDDAFMQGVGERPACALARRSR
jgi:hypothetical protein